MKPNLLIPFALLVLTSCHSNGQQKTKPSSNPQPTYVTLLAKEVLQDVPDRRYDGLQPDDLAPDVVTIDADEIRQLINGVCIVVKGNQMALVDLKGNFVTPWGKYKFETPRQLIPFTTLIPVTDQATHLCGFINVKGQVVIPFAFNSIEEFNCYRLTRVTGAGFRFHKILDTKGNLYPQFDAGYFGYDYSQRELYTKPQPANRLLTTHDQFVNKAGQVVINDVFQRAHEFTEGLAAVKHLDQFGVSKWGFIDTAGKVVIPYMYQNEPGSFHDGLAMVTPVEKTDFDYAYIDKHGAIKIKVGDGHSLRKPGAAMGGNFIHGYSIWYLPEGNYHALLDTNGVFHKLTDMTQDPLLAKGNGDFILGNIDDLGIQFKSPEYFSYTHGNLGMIDYTGKVLFPFTFDELAPDYYSHYGLATVRVQNSTPKRGVVNSQGVFVLVLGKKSTF